MIIRDLLDLVSKEKRKQERAEIVRKVATGMGIVTIISMVTGLFLTTKSGKKVSEDVKEKAVNTVNTFKEKVQETADVLRNSAVQTSQDVSKDIHDIQGRTKRVKRDVKDGYQQIKKDISKTAEKIVDDH